MSIQEPSNVEKLIMARTRMSDAVDLLKRHEEADSHSTPDVRVVHAREMLEKTLAETVVHWNPPRAQGGRS